ncbi:hypothetical protein [Butyrivibrio sp. AE2032]|uniref:hypothetical protein n=1 Tax=Butyrivibrio sp. AE2032 TaxID=1458463 RepID=UPI000551976F|nr:hypothetical protein [Butyrivibrio sp. AE2032]
MNYKLEIKIFDLKLSLKNATSRFAVQKLYHKVQGEEIHLENLRTKKSTANRIEVTKCDHKIIAVNLSGWLDRE